MRMTVSVSPVIDTMISSSTVTGPTPAGVPV